MTSKLKQRLIGIFVLIALTLIVAPLFIHQHHKANKPLELSVSIPNAPATPVIPKAPPTPDVTAEADDTTIIETVQAEVITETPMATPDELMEAVAQQQKGLIEPASLPSHIATIETTTTSEATAPIPASQIVMKPTVTEKAAPAAQPQAPVIAKAAAPQPQKAVAAKATTATAAPNGKIIITAPTETKALLIKKPAAKIVKKAAPKKHVAKKKRTHLAKTKKTSGSAVWTIRLGSFSNTHNAQKLVKQLRKKGFTAYVRDHKVKTRVYTQVFVGPVIQRTRAEKLKQRLNKQFHLKGIVSRFHARS